MSSGDTVDNNNMSSAKDIPQTQAANNDIISGSPGHNREIFVDKFMDLFSITDSTDRCPVVIQ